MTALAWGLVLVALFFSAIVVGVALWALVRVVAGRGD